MPPWSPLRAPTAPVAPYRLPPRLARALERLAPAIVVAPAPPVRPAQVVAQAERWLGYMPATARARVVRMLLLLEWAPLVRGWPPLSRMRPEQVSRYVAGPLAAPRGFWATLGRARQLVRLAWYADPSTHAQLGFVPPAERAAVRRVAAAGSSQGAASAEQPVGLGAGA